jgi:hypothetical protein
VDNGHSGDPNVPSRASAWYPEDHRGAHRDGKMAVQLSADLDDVATPVTGSDAERVHPEYDEQQAHGHGEAAGGH